MRAELSSDATLFSLPKLASLRMAQVHHSATYKFNFTRKSEDETLSLI